MADNKRGGQESSLAAAARGHTQPAADGKKKKVAPISKEKFLKAAPTLGVEANDGTRKIPFLAVPKEFSTGSFGWGISDKATVMVDGIPVPCQLSFNLTVIGSKPE